MRLSRKAFEAWLQEKPKAKAGGLCRCPIATCFKFATVNYDTYYEQETTREIRLPAWARAFTRAVDRHTPVLKDQRRNWGALTRSQVLKILKEEVK